MKTIFISLLVLLSVMLAGCAVSPGGYSRTSTDRICMEYLTLPSYNINQGERAAELARRDESCQGYVAAAKMRQEAQRAQGQIITQGSSNPPPLIYPQEAGVILQPQNSAIPSQCTSVNIGGIIDTRCQPVSGSTRQPQCTSIDLGGGIIDTRCR